ncbi:hypothetical protein PNOK_0658900 [Pyrrhoderma noxium]|uniref:DUF6533 domain-containing protein n=1 Tax=Pyrrhoderma noxium TaxID=2282107 RepID=A0A286UES5_9AGAM|nr:hypothetical protein PNOK_0658900 [Pyrrhoderma noxium]
MLPTEDPCTLQADLSTLKYFFFSAASLTCYEYFLTWDYEIQYLWTRPVSFWRLIFFVNRYTPYVGIVTLAAILFLPVADFKTCNSLVLAFQIVISANILPAIIVIMACLCLLTLIIVGITLYILSFFMNESLLSGKPESVVECIGVNPLNWIIFAIFLFEETACIVLISIKKYETYRSDKDTSFISPLLRVLVDDGLIYYAYSIFLALVDFAILFFPKLRAVALGVIGIDSALHSILCTHLSIRLRETYETTLWVEESLGTEQLYELCGPH